MQITSEENPPELQELNRLAQVIDDDLNAGREPEVLKIRPIPDGEDKPSRDIRNAENHRDAWLRKQIGTIGQRFPSLQSCTRTLSWLAHDLLNCLQEPASLMPNLERNSRHRQGDRPVWGCSKQAEDFFNWEIPRCLEESLAQTAIWQHLGKSIPRYRPENPEAILQAGRMWATATASKTQQWLIDQDFWNEANRYLPLTRRRFQGSKPLPTDDGGPYGRITLEMTLGEKLSKVIHPWAEQGKVHPDGRRSTRHTLRELGSDRFDIGAEKYTYYYGLKVRDLYLSLWLESVERIGPYLAADGAIAMSEDATIPSRECNPLLTSIHKQALGKLPAALQSLTPPSWPTRSTPCRTHSRP